MYVIYVYLYNCIYSINCSETTPKRFAGNIRWSLPRSQVEWSTDRSRLRLPVYQHTITTGTTTADMLYHQLRFSPSIAPWEMKQLEKGLGPCVIKLIKQLGLFLVLHAFVYSILLHFVATVDFHKCTEVFTIHAAGRMQSQQMQCLRRLQLTQSPASDSMRWAELDADKKNSSLGHGYAMDMTWITVDKISF